MSRDTKQFLEECNCLIELDVKLVNDRSVDFGEQQFDGMFGPKENDRRTSSNNSPARLGRVQE